MSEPRTKGKRVLPNIPGQGVGLKRSVTFNNQTIETSIGGTNTPGKIKGDPFSPVNRSTLDDCQPRNLNGEFESFDDSSTQLELEKSSKKMAKSDKNTNVSVEVILSNGKKIVNGESGNVDSDKENTPGVALTAEQTPVKNSTRVMNGHGDVESRVFQSPNLPVRYKTPVRRHTMDEKIFGTPECFSIVQLDRQRYDFGLYEDGSRDGEDSCSVTVAVRVRPFSQRELADPGVRKVVSIDGNQATVTTDSNNTHNFAYDFAFSSFDRADPSYSSQEHVFKCLAQPLLGKAFEGYNTCLFAYGQTGSGKSYCIMGHGEDIGIIPRFCEELFARADVAKDLKQVKIHVEISFFEIYNEKIHDLLASTNKEKKAKKTTLRVREHPTLGPYVEGLSTFVVNSFEDMEGWITLGNKNRATAATGMNDKSSRSHSVFTIVLTQTKTEVLEGQEHDHCITSKINLVDLAGSERQSQAQTSGQRLREGANINKSLLTLGKVISQLAEQSNLVNKRKKIFIPYRDSVLTWLLKESLGGNSKTAMIATISPANHHTDETLSTLRYAQTARSIVNLARVNEDPKAKLIRELRAEIEHLKASGLSTNDDAYAESLYEINSLRERLAQKDREMEEITKSWQERLRQSEERKQEEAKLLEKAGVTLKVDNKLPNLVNLNEDPQLSEMLLYVLKDGITKVGRMGPDSKHEIQLNGALIADNHCLIKHTDNTVTLIPLGDAPTYVNGNLIADSTDLHHGDRVILGGDHYFRFNHPIEVEKSKRGKQSPQKEMKDFEFAKAELMRVQEARLQEERRKAQAEMLIEVEQAKKDAEEKFANMEKIMREESAEKEKVAEDVILKLKKQKMMLEQEVIAGRKRQQLEAEAALKSEQLKASEKPRIVELLEEQMAKESQRLEELKRKRSEMVTRVNRPVTIQAPVVEPSSELLGKWMAKESQRLEELKRKRSEMMTRVNRPVTIQTPVLEPSSEILEKWMDKESQRLEELKRKRSEMVTRVNRPVTIQAPVVEPSSGKMDLYKIALQVREANKISQYLKKHTMFSREDYLENEEMKTVIKVTNKKLDVCTYWSLAKFEEKLFQMRDIYQNESESSADDEVFNDPSDHWGRDSVSNSPISPNSGQRRSAPSPGLCKALLSSTSSSVCIQDASSIMDTTRLAGPVVPSLCKDIINVTLSQCKSSSLEESIADKVLHSCQTLKTCLVTVSELPSILEKNNNENKVERGEVFHVTCIQMTNSFQLLLNYCNLWSSMYQNLQSALIHDLLTRMNDHCKVIGNQMIRFLQGCEGDINELIVESSSKLNDSIHIMCKLNGELALATDTRMVYFEDTGLTNSADIVIKEICRSFLSGCETFIDKTLQGALRTVEEFETRAQIWSDTQIENQSLEKLPQNVEICVSSCKDLLLKCQEIQVEVENSMFEKSFVCPLEFCSGNYRRSQTLISHVSSLVEATGLLVQNTEPIVEGTESDVRQLLRCSDLIKKCSDQLTRVSGLDLVKISRRSIDASESVFLSETQVEQLEYICSDLQESLMTLTKCVQQFMELERATRTKRLLPSQPGATPRKEKS